MNTTGRVHVAIPGQLGTPTGGYGYDRNLMAELRAAGWEVCHLALPEGFPFPDAMARAAAAAAIAALPSGALVMIDGLAFGSLPEVAASEAARLHLVSLVHHPLGDESGLCAATAAELLAGEAEALKHARRVICTSAATAARLISALGVPAARVIVAPPGTEPAMRSQGGSSSPRILSVGSLVPRKRHDVLIDALGRLSDRDWSARIVGSATLDPGCAASLTARIEAAGLGRRVALAGAVQDTRSELAVADVFALASEYEGYGMAFAEALSQGVPIVGCRSPAVEALVPPAAGALVPVGDVEAFAGALARLLDDPELRRGAAEAAFAAGQRLPRWKDTAAIVAEALAAVR